MFLYYTKIVFSNKFDGKQKVGEVSLEKDLKFNEKNLNHGFIITGLLGLVEDEGLSPHEAFRVVEDIKNQTF